MQSIVRGLRLRFQRLSSDNQHQILSMLREATGETLSRSDLSIEFEELLRKLDIAGVDAVAYLMDKYRNVP